ncbi:hypothetical protein EXS65_04350 [Candidatus Peribacteria bacterium]|nr:hypothetical protein [Candidatus Peribacteria bacterium]
MSMPAQFSWKHGVRVVLAMGFADFMLKYRGSVLGFLWSFIIPIVKFLVIYHVFQPFIQGVEHYQLYLFLGLILWEHFSLMTTACMSMLHEKAAIVQKVAFPRMLLILSVGWTHTLILLSYFVIFLCIALAMGIEPTWGLLYVPLIFVQATLLGLSVGMILSCYSLKFADLQHLWSVLLQVIFWLTPIIYPYTPKAPLAADFANLFSGSLQLSFWSLFDIFIRFQPLSILLHDARRAILYPSTVGVPSLIHAVGFSVICLLLFVACAILFRKRSRYFIQEY